jgi:hypothetical protein
MQARFGNLGEALYYRNSHMEACLFDRSGSLHTYDVAIASGATKLNYRN